MAMQWYYCINNEEFGPISSQELKQLADSGELQPDDEVWRDGAPDWVPARTVSKLFTASAPDPPSVSPTPQNPTPQNPAPGMPPAIDIGAASPTAARLKATGQKTRKRRTATAGRDRASSGTIPAVKKLLVNPVGELAPVFETIGPKSAMKLGLIFLGAAIVLMLLGELLAFKFIFKTYFGMDLPFKAFLSFKLIFQSILINAIMAGSLLGACAICRAMLSGKGGFAGDLFISGLVNVLAGMCIFILGLFSLVIQLSVLYWLIGLLLFFLVSTVILVLFIGCTRIQKIPEGAATFMVPLILLMSEGITYLVFYLLN